MKNIIPFFRQMSRSKIKPVSILFESWNFNVIIAIENFLHRHTDLCLFLTVKGTSKFGRCMENTLVTSAFNGTGLLGNPLEVAFDSFFNGTIPRPMSVLVGIGLMTNVIPVFDVEASISDVLIFDSHFDM